jgi:hypothetical protein
MNNCSSFKAPVRDKKVDRYRYPYNIPYLKSIEPTVCDKVKTNLIHKVWMFLFGVSMSIIYLEHLFFVAVRGGGAGGRL